MKKRLAIALAVLAAASVQADEASTSAEPSHVELDTTTIKASKELPSVMAVVPWKKALPADLGGRPDTSLVDGLLQPLDPEVFRLQLEFYEQLFISKESSPDGADDAKRESK